MPALDFVTTEPDGAFTNLDVTKGIIEIVMPIGYIIPVLYTAGLNVDVLSGSQINPEFSQ